MRYVVCGMPQRALIEWGLDIVDAEIIRWFIDFYHSGKMAKVKDVKTEKEYAWVKYQAVIDDLPILGIHNTDVMARRFKKISAAGIFEHYTHISAGVYSCYKINTNRYDILLSERKDITPIDDYKVDPPTIQSEYPDLKVGVYPDLKVGTKDSNTNIDTNTNNNSSGGVPPTPALKKDIQFANIELPPALDTPAFRAAWDDWVQHRKEIKKKLTPLAARQQLKNLADVGEREAIAAIKKSIGNGWQGLFVDAKPASKEQTRREVKGYMI